MAQEAPRTPREGRNTPPEAVKRPPKGPRACPKGSQKHRSRPNCTGVSRWLHVLFLICYFFGFRFVFTEMPWKLATQGLSSLPQALPESPLQAKLYLCFAFFAFSVFDLMLFQCSVYFRQDALQIAPRSPYAVPRGPRHSQKSPRMHPRVRRGLQVQLKMSPRGSKLLPRGPHRAPSGPQELPRSPQEAPAELLVAPSTSRATSTRNQSAATAARPFQ